MNKATKLALMIFITLAAVIGSVGCSKEPPPGWTSQKRPVEVATPDGRETKSVTYYKNSLGMEFVHIPAGEFMLGSGQTVAESARLCSAGGGEDWHKDEHPQHKTLITKAFFMGATEVTQAQYMAIMKSVDPKDEERVLDTGDPSRFKGDDNPVEEVSWDDAIAFCKKLSERDGVTYRLPTEAEWEYACRAGTTTPFSTGATISTDLANYNGDHTYGKGAKGVNRKITTPVATFPANPWGLYDMHGNVWEWCQDWYGADRYEKDPPDAPAEGVFRVLRGGSWDDLPMQCRSAYRFRFEPEAVLRFNGFRVVLESLQPRDAKVAE